MSFLVTVIAGDSNSGEDVLYVVQPEKGITLISNSLYLLRRSLFNRTTNLAHALSYDKFYEGVTKILKKPLPGSRSLFFCWRPREEEIAPVQALLAAVSFEDDVIRVNASADFFRGGIEIVDRLYSPPPPKVRWEEYVDRESAAVLGFHDQDAARYLHTFGQFKRFQKLFNDDYGGVLGDLSAIPGFQHFIISITGYRDRLPELVVGIWASPERLRKLVSDLQIRYRHKRDRAILKGAVTAFQKSPRATKTPPPGPSVADLRQYGFLTKETPEILQRYQVRMGEITDASLTSVDFQNASYQRTYRNWTIEYLVSQIGPNDLRYRSRFKGLSRQDLLSDDYRLAFVLNNDVLWVATDSKDLERLIDRVSTGVDNLGKSQLFRNASSNWSGNEKFFGFINLDKMTSLGLLSPESNIEDGVKKYLLDLHGHPALSFQVVSDGTIDRVGLSVRILNSAKPKRDE